MNSDAAEAIFLSDRVVVMSPRAGRIDNIIDISLPRPRELHMTTEPEFNAYVQDIRQIFERRGVLKDEPDAAQGQPPDPCRRSSKYYSASP